MADRVAIIGGKTVGRDHVPLRSRAADWTPAVLTNDEHFPLDIAAANGRGSGYLFPWGFTVTEFLRYLLLVKTWHFECDLTIARSDSFGEGDDQYYAWTYGTIHIEADITFWMVADSVARLVNREADTPQAGGGFAIQFRVDSDGTYGFNSRGNASFSDDFAPRVSNLLVSGDFSYVSTLLVNYIQGSEFTSGEPTIVDRFETGAGYGGFVDGLFWPTIKAEVEMSGVGHLGVSWWQGATFDATEDKGTLVFDGSSVPILGFPIGDAIDSPGGLALSSVLISVAPVEFWPYANSKGHPVYNTSTGALMDDSDNPGHAIDPLS
jgi:hypothetical protein